MMSRNLCLAGMMGAGKTTVAQILGQRLGRRVVDSDHEIERWTGQTVAALFASVGEAGFRDLERTVVAELARPADLVISLGGGTIISDENVAALRLTGVIVHLDAPVEILARRLEAAGDSRPLLNGVGDLAVEARLRALSEERAARYGQVCDVVVDAVASPDEVASEILAWAMAQGDILTPSEHEQVMT